MTLEELAEYRLFGSKEPPDQTFNEIRYKRAILLLCNEIERLQILFAYTEGDLPGRLSAKALGADGFEMTLLIEAAVKAGEELVRNGYPLKNDSPPTP